MSVPAESAAVPSAEGERNTYMIIRGTDQHDLAGAVNDAMRRGWKPLGGVVYVPMDPLAVAALGPGGRPQHLPYWQALTRD